MRPGPQGPQGLPGVFQSTHPVRGATPEAERPVLADRISIHAPREGCDKPDLSVLKDMQFQSTHPVRGATSLANRINPVGEFQSTHPVRGATPDRSPDGGGQGISIHAPREGCDPSTTPGMVTVTDFNPRTP